MKLTIDYTITTELPAFYVTKADVLAIRFLGYDDAETYMRAAHPDASDSTISQVVVLVNKDADYLAHCAHDDRFVRDSRTEPGSFTLDPVDEVVFRALLYRYVSPGETPVPKQKITAIKYLRVKYSMGLKQAKDLMDAIDARVQMLA